MLRMIDPRHYEFRFPPPELHTGDQSWRLAVGRVLRVDVVRCCPRAHTRGARRCSDNVPSYPGKAEEQAPLYTSKAIPRP